MSARVPTDSGSLEDLLTAVRDTLRQHQHRLGDEDLRVLRAMVVPLTVALRATARSEELQVAREQLVAAREEERRQLRRELHDGLGPTLAAIALGLPAAKNSIGRDPTQACTLLTELGLELQGAIGEIRRVVKGLRPPALDQFGLVTAIREYADQQNSGVRITIDAPDPLRPLPAAVEVAAYRIVCEALTNVTRHAHARHCQVRMWLDEDLHIEVADDGVGIHDIWHGVGLASMRRYATELGGDCVVCAMSDGGTKVLAKLPLRT